MLELTRAHLDAMRAHGEAAFPEEACGFLLGTASPDGARKRLAHARAAANEKQGERERRYVISPPAVLAAEEEALRLGLDVLGFYHSHPSGVARPSDFDRDHAWPWYTYVIVGVTAGKAGDTTAWRLRDDRTGFIPEEMLQIHGSG